MQIWARRRPGRADSADGLALLHVLPQADGDAAQVRVGGGGLVGVLNHDVVAIATLLRLVVVITATRVLTITTTLWCIVVLLVLVVAREPYEKIKIVFPRYFLKGLQVIFPAAFPGTGQGKAHTELMGQSVRHANSQEKKAAGNNVENLEECVASRHKRFT